MEKKTNRDAPEKPLEPGVYPIIGGLPGSRLEIDLSAVGRKELIRPPFPLGVYPVFDDDLPRDNTFENFPAPDLRDGHPYPKGLD